MAVAGTGPSAGMGGMLREWTFSATLEHKQARIKLRMLPQWVVANLDSDEVAQVPDPLRKYTAIKPFLTFRDLTASAKAGELWEEVEKCVTFYRGRLQVNAPLRDWCKRCIQLVLSDERTVAVDGERRLQSITVGDKVRRSPYKLGGHPTFCFEYSQCDKTAAATDTSHMAVGAMVNGVGYLVLIGCTRREELLGYVNDTLMPSIKGAEECQLDVDVKYTECPHTRLNEMQELFGALRYFDRAAAIEFSLPMHPMHLRPDHSPLQSAGFGSLACLTLDLEVYQKLYDDAGGEGGATTAQSSQTTIQGIGLPGEPQYKPNNVVLYIEVEDVVKIGFPPVMSVDQYAALKTKKLIDTFRDARIVGAPLSRPLGQRVGRSTTCTFMYEMEVSAGGTSAASGLGRQQRRTVSVTVKALIVTTLVGNHGATAVYFTKLGQAVFDTHLYVFQHLTRSLHFYTERELVGAFSKDTAARIRLTDQDLPRAYAAGGEKARPALKKHLAAIKASADGEVEGAVVIPVKPPDEDDDAAQAAHDASALVAGGEDLPVPDFALGAGDRDDDASVISVKDIAHLADLEALVQTPEVPPSSDDESGGDFAATATEADLGATAAEGGAASAGRRSSATGRRASAGSEAGGFGKGPQGASESPRPGDAAGESGDEGDRSGADDEAGPDEDEVNAAVAEALRAPAVHRGPALRGVYKTMCDEEGAKPNSYLLQKLPDDPRFTTGIEELDLSFNYVGHAGFRAILRLLAYLPKLRTVHFNAMSLDNADVDALCKQLAHNKTVRHVNMRNNARISLPASPHMLRLLRTNTRIQTLAVSGSSMSHELVAKIEGAAAANAARAKAAAAQPSEEPKEQAQAAPSGADAGDGDTPVPGVVVDAPTASEAEPTGGSPAAAAPAAQAPNEQPAGSVTVVG